MISNEKNDHVWTAARLVESGTLHQARVSYLVPTRTNTVELHRVTLKPKLPDLRKINSVSIIFLVLILKII